MRVTLDTNVYISALHFGGRSTRLLGMALAGAIRIDFSDQIEDELVRVLREDFHWEGYRIHFLKQRLARLTNRVVPVKVVAAVEDPDDNKILECALAAESDYVVTEDKALLRLHEHEGIKIRRVAEFLDVISKLP